MTLRDVAFIGITGFFAAFLIVIFGAVMYINLNSALVQIPVINENADVMQVINDGQFLVNQFDKVIIAYFFSVLLVLIVTSWFVAGHPIGIIAYFLGGGFVIFASMFMSNIWAEIMVTNAFQPTTALFPFANWIMNNLGLYIGITWFIGLLVTFVKPAFTEGRFSSDGGGFV